MPVIKRACAQYGGRMLWFVTAAGLRLSENSETVWGKKLLQNLAVRKLEDQMSVKVKIRMYSNQRE